METLERLERLLDAKDHELEAAHEANLRLERELEGVRDGWRRAEELQDDGTLPIPRLELVYVQDDEWRSYHVMYRIVQKHLLGHLVATPLGRTKIDGGANREPEPDHLPFRDGVHAAHDAGHLQMPLFKLMPGRAPERLAPYAETAALGQKARRFV